VHVHMRGEGSKFKMVEMSLLVVVEPSLERYLGTEWSPRQGNLCGLAMLSPGIYAPGKAITPLAQSISTSILFFGERSEPN
jgi:hypothetical protein